MCHAHPGSGWLVVPKTTNAVSVNGGTPSWSTSCTVNGRQDSLNSALSNSP